MIFGSHAAALYNAEAVKTQVWKSGRAPAIAGALLGAFIAIPQQAYTDAAPCVFAPSAAPIVGPALTAQYQFGTHAATLYNAESAKTRVWSSAAAPVTLPTGKLGQWATSTPQAVDLSLQPFFDAPQPAGARPRVPPSVWTAPQAYSDVAPNLFSSSAAVAAVSGNAPTAQYQFGTHAAALYNAEAAKSRVWPSAAAPVVLTTGKLGQWAAASPQAADLALQPFFDAPQLNPQGWLLAYFSAGPDSSEYPTIQATLTPAATAHASVPGILAPYFSTPEQAYFNPAPVVFRAAVPDGGPTLGAVTIVQQQSYADIQPRITQSVIAGSVPPIGAVPLPVRAAPQAFDSTLQPFFDAPQPGPLPHGNLGSFVIAPAQQFDYTLQATYTAPLSAAVAFTIKAAERLSLDDYGRRLVL